MQSPKANVPLVRDLNVDNITENTIAINSQSPNPRLNYVLERLVSHLHDFARETRLSTKEWRAGLEFLTEVGQKCTDVRQEFILLSDILGLSVLIDAINHPKPPHSTEGSVLGPFHSHEAEDIRNGGSISHDTKGEQCLVICSVKDPEGIPIEGVKIDIWEADSAGRYDLQYANRKGPDGRGVMSSDKNGQFWFTAVKPVPYPIPADGPVGRLLETLHRHAYRPAHIHFMFEKPGYDNLVTALYLRGDPHEKSDAVFGVKDSLLVDINAVDEEIAKKYGVDPGTLLLEYGFVLITEKEASDLRDQKSEKALAGLGRKMMLVNGLPVPEVD